ncbi:PREDICTED: WAP four-disulfide core domain protein 3, partial [Tinamus guttatus]|uniref:WAP four-disulfide core domain protein 3 n=1 Tax=Tinamus guttatus TaxID=94827 RepID=UPI00052F2E50
PREAGTCLELCTFDEECPWGHKCCSNGCGRVCMVAALPESDGVAVPWDSTGRCRDECDTDAQCPWGQRCTSRGCGRVCIDVPRDAA